MSIHFNEDALRRLNAEAATTLATQLQPSFEDFQANWLGKPEGEVKTALRSYLASSPMEMSEQGIANTAKSIANGQTVNLRGGG